jgi:hypothetical protein
MPVLTSPRGRDKYRTALMEIDMALINLGEGLREDLETDREALRVIYEELSDARRRLERLVRERAG